jgi:Fe-S cluster biogenesis protein NfuA
MINPSSNDSTPDSTDPNLEGDPAGSLKSRVAEVLELIRPAVQEDGGDIELVEVCHDGTVTIRFLGACIGCPSSEITLRDGIARNLRERVPEVTDVVAID